MRFKNCTLAYVKDLYMQKVKAVNENDQSKIDYFKSNLPELFNADFLMDVLRNEFEKEKSGLSDDEFILKNYLFHYH